MLHYRVQKNLTISEEQAILLKENVGKMTIDKLAIMLGLPFQKTYNNMKVLKLTKQKLSRRPKYKIINNVTTRIIDISTHDGFLDMKKFGKLYEY